MILPPSGSGSSMPNSSVFNHKISGGGREDTTQSRMAVSPGRRSVLLGPVVMRGATGECATKKEREREVVGVLEMVKFHSLEALVFPENGWVAKLNRAILHIQSGPGRRRYVYNHNIIATIHECLPSLMWNIAVLLPRVQMEQAVKYMPGLSCQIELCCHVVARGLGQSKVSQVLPSCHV